MCSLLYSSLLLFLFISRVLFNKTEEVLPHFNQTKSKFYLKTCGGRKQNLKEAFVHAYVNLPSIHTNKQQDANIEIYALGSKLTETKFL